MSDVTRLIHQIQEGDQAASEQLLPLVYDELRKLAAAKMAGERRDHTLPPTALVHEAYLRLVGPGDDSSNGNGQWDGRGHFFAAAAEAMRRILVDHARNRQRLKRGGDRQRIAIELTEPFQDYDPSDLLTLNDAIDELAETDRQLAELVKLRVFVGMSNRDVASTLRLPESTAKKHWLYAKAWLRRRMQD